MASGAAGARGRERGPRPVGVSRGCALQRVVKGSGGLSGARGRAVRGREGREKGEREGNDAGKKKEREAKDQIEEDKIIEGVFL